jgi:A/G-specific adenine glycosylase
MEEDVRKGEAAKLLRESARRMLSGRSPSEVNQGLMELGATVCVPKRPRCERCPWEDLCRARKGGEPTAYPRRRVRPQPIEVSSYAAVVCRGDRYLWRRRPEGSHNAGLWELPTTPWHPGAPEAALAQGGIMALGRELGVELRPGEALASIRHGITRHRVTVVAYAVRCEGAISRERLRWADAEQGRRLGMTAATAKLLRKLPPLL